MKAQINIEGTNSTFADEFFKLSNKFIQDLTAGVILDKEKMKIEVSVSNTESEQ